MGSHRHTAFAVVGLVAIVVGGGCSSDGSTTAPSTTTTTRPAPRAIELVATATVDAIYAQGIARAGDGWILSGTNVLGRTGADVAVIDAQQTPVIPPDLAARGYDHVGDVDVADIDGSGDLLYAPLEQPDNDLGEQVTAWYDAETLEFVGSVDVPQHHNSFVAVDPRTKVAYSTDQFDDDTLLRYDVGDGWAPMEPLKLSRTIERIQGGAVGGGAFWISTDDDQNGVYRVDLRSGAVRFLGSMGHGAGEGEGIAYAQLPDGSELHTVTVDAGIIPVYVDHWRLTR